MVIVAGLKNGAEVLSPILFAIVLGILFTPTLQWMENKGAPAFVALSIMVVAIVAIVAALAAIVITSLHQLSANLPHYSQLLTERLAPLKSWLIDHGFHVQPLFDTIGAALKDAVLHSVGPVISGIVGAVFFVFILILILIDASSYGEALRRGSPRGARLIEGFSGVAKEVQQQYRIQTLSNFLSAAAILAELLVFNVDLAVLWSFLAFVLGYIPNIGLILAVLPAILLAFIEYGWQTAIVILALTIGLNALMDNVVTPRFNKTRLGLPMSVTFIALIFWSWVFGWWGSLLAVPLTLAIRALVRASAETQLLARLMSVKVEADATAPAATEAE